MKIFVGVTDGDWFRYLRAHPELDEINFWQPGGNRQFRALDPGDLFLFKLHSPQNFIVGGGLFAYFSIYPASVVWDVFREKNGAATFREMRTRIERYRRIPHRPHEDYKVGCIILEAPFFFHQSEWIPVPEDFSPNIVQGKTYDLTTARGSDLWEAVRLRLMALQPLEVAESLTGVFGDPRLIRPRLGQGAFRFLVTDTYQRRCAATGERALPVLEAAHVLPVAEGGSHTVSNGLLLRSDLHRLFDRGYLTITPEHKLRVSRRLKEEFDNGEIYYPLEGQEIWLPHDLERRPRRELLEWHSQVVFRG